MNGVRGLPRVAILCAESAIPAAALASLTRAHVRQRASLPTQCELAFASPPAEFAPRLGSALRLQVGDGQLLFAGEVTGVEHVYGPHAGRELRVRAYDLTHRLRNQQPVQARAQFTLRELAGELLQPLGLSVQCERDSALWPYWIQYDQSNLALLAELAARTGLYFFAAEDGVRIFDLEAGAGPVCALGLGRELRELAIEASSAIPVAAVRAASWSAGDLITEQAEGAAGSAEASSDGPRHLANCMLPSAEHLEALATARAGLPARAALVLRGVAEGDAALSPGARVRVEGLPDASAPEAVLVYVEHTLDGELGYVTTFDSAPPEPLPSRNAALFTLAVVTRVEASGGRVKLRLPALFDVETDWVQVVSAGAGAGKGWVALPNVDDRVAVVYAQDNPAQCVVLGGLYGKDGPRDNGVEGGRSVRFTLRTSQGSVLSFDDGAKAIRIEDPSGSSLLFSPDEVRLAAKVPLVLEAPGQPIVVRGDTVDFQRG